MQREPAKKETETMKQNISGDRVRQLWTPRETHVDPALPAWKRKYWEDVKALKQKKLAQIEGPAAYLAAKICNCVSLLFIVVFYRSEYQKSDLEFKTKPKTDLPVSETTEAVFHQTFAFHRVASFLLVH
jgi:hypothetical protein